MTDCLVHHGVKGQKWGVRRYQYADGSLTPAGRKRYSGKPSDRVGLKAKELVNSARTHITGERDYGLE